MKEQMLSIEVTTRCNLKCKNCFAHADKAEWRDIPLEMSKDIVKEGAHLGYNQLSLTGGEPFLWPHILELIDFAINNGYVFILINSNVHLLNDSLCSQLEIFRDKVEITCSLNGFKEEHDQIRGTGSYELAVKGITTGLKHNLKLHIYTVINRKNLKDLPRFSSLLFLNFSGINAHVLIQQRGIENDYYQIKDLMLEPPDFIEMVKMAAYLSLSGNSVQILENSLATVVASILGFKWFILSPEISRPGKIVVLQDGTITDNHSSFKVLGIYETGMLREILSSQEYRDITEKESELCLSCEFMETCRSNGKIKPSSKFHNMGDNSIPFCRKVLGLLN